MLLARLRKKKGENTYSNIRNEGGDITIKRI